MARMSKTEKILRADIRWAIKNKTWNPGVGAIQVDGKWIDTGTYYDDKPCGVCAIGAHVVRCQPKPKEGHESDVFAAARSLRKSEGFIEDIYYAVMETKRYREKDPTPGQAMGYRLRDYADKYRKEWEARR